MNEKLHLDILPDDQIQLLKRLSDEPFINEFYLAGGTCLALQIGHRKSIDFDFFIQKDFDTSSVISLLIQFGNFQRENEEKNTINGILDGIRISFFGYKYKIIDDFWFFNQIRIAGLKDIAAMKLEAIAGRGSRKDFIDFYFLLNQFTLEEMLSFHLNKYGAGLSNRYHLLKSLTYFMDAENEAMPLMTKHLDWEKVKEQIITTVKNYPG